MSFGATVAQIMSLFLIMIVGYIMNKKGIIDDAANVRYTRLILNISLPAQIIKAFIENQGIVSNQVVLMVFGISIAAYAIYGIVGAVFVFLTKVPKRQRGTYMFMMMFGNVGYMGFPVIQAILGDEAMIYAVIFNVVFNVLVYSMGIVLINSNESEAHFEIKKLLNVPFISALISIVLYFTNIKLPDMVMDSLDIMGNMTTPVAMLILGSTIANMPIRELFDEWRIYIFTIFKLAIIPIIAILLMKLVPVESELITGCMIILSATPVATNTTMLAIEYGGDIKLGSKGVFFTTILCMITIPLITAIY
ncbi:MAG: AEC family transporter [Tyzzerella sp.]|nr:AEC family transporter [Tyzzerella sp.]